MIRATSSAIARATRVGPHPIRSGRGDLYVTEFIGGARDMAPADQPGPWPQAFLIEQLPDSRLDPHFHQSDEFQVVMQGGGALGRRPLAALAVHFVNRHTAYGPVTAGNDGLHYFTLRRRADSGASFMHAARGALDRTAPKRQVTSRSVACASADELAQCTARAVDALIAPEPDGVAAELHRLPPRAAFPCEIPPTGDRFYIVVGGAAQQRAIDYPALSAFFISADERDFVLTAGDGGAEILMLQFPRDGAPPTGRRARP